MIGATGFLGRHVVESLAADPVISLRLLARQAIPTAFPGWHTIQGDLLSPEACRRLVAPESTVVNLAYQPSATRQQNLQMAENLAAACLEASARGLVNCSTAVVAGRASTDVVTESTVCRPVTEYQQTKLDIEELLLAKLAGRCPVTILRPTAIFGPGGHNLVKFADTLTRRTRLDNWLRAALLWTRRLHLVCVENVTAAVRFLVGRCGDLANERFIVSDDDFPENNYRDIMAILAAEMNRPSPARVGVSFNHVILTSLLRLVGRSDPNPRRIFSGRKLLDLGYERQLMLADGIRRFARWYAKPAAAAGAHA